MKARATDRRFAFASPIVRIHASIFHGSRSHCEETSAPCGSFALPMNVEREKVRKPEIECMDRRLIRIDVPAAHAGITAALRRAFEAAASEPSDRDFAELLRQLN